MAKVESESRNKHLKYVLKEKELNALKAKMIEIQQQADKATKAQATSSDLIVKKCALESTI